MTAKTLRQADQYLIENGFSLTKTTNLGDELQATYGLGNLQAKPPVGIHITLHDYGDGHWTFGNFVIHSGDFTAKVREVMDALGKLPGFEPHRV